MENSNRMGLNRTGIDMAPLASHAMQTFAEAQSPAAEPRPEDENIAAVRADYASAAERIGSVPLPGTLTGAVSTGFAMLTGKNPEVFLDKLGERLAFERSGVRLYQALIDKAGPIAATGPLPFGIDELERIRDEELQHMQWVAAAMKSLGADPTAQTPCADVSGVASAGIMQVLSDPRTNLAQCLNAILSAELTDHAGWELLIELTKEAGQDRFLPDFRKARHHEKEHLEKVRGWLAGELLQEAA